MRDGSTRWLWLRKNEWTRADGVNSALGHTPVWRPSESITIASPWTTPVSGWRSKISTWRRIRPGRHRSSSPIMAISSPRPSETKVL